MKTKISLLILAMLQLSVMTGFSQTAHISIENTVACDSTEILVPVHIDNFYNIGAITIFIGFDSEHLDCLSVENVSSQFPGLLYNIITEPQTMVGISWISINGVNVSSAKFFDLKIFYKSGVTDLSFTSGCEITTPDLEIIDVIYTNGNLSPSIEVLHQPEDVTINQPAGVLFSIEEEGANFLQWQRSVDEGLSFSDLEDSGIFSGVTTSLLVISSTSDDLNNNLFRCELSNPNCLMHSQNALLTVLPVMYTQTATFLQGWNSYATHLLPTDLNFETLFAPIMSSIEIISDGEGVYHPAGGLNTIGDFNPVKGYILKLNSETSFSLNGYENQGATLQIPEGQAYLPVLASCNVSVETLFAGHTDKLDIIRELPGLDMVWPAQNIQSLVYLESGKSYLIETSGSFEITFPVCH
jgi:hypothetical protein